MIHKIKQCVEDDINDYLNSFPKATRKEAEQMILLMKTYVYIGNALSEEDLIKCADYLGYELDMDVIKEEKRKFYEEHQELLKESNNEDNTGNSDKT